jgi:hypothetical protein
MTTDSDATEPVMADPFSSGAAGVEPLMADPFSSNAGAAEVEGGAAVVAELSAWVSSTPASSWSART